MDPVELAARPTRRPLDVGAGGEQRGVELDLVLRGQRGHALAGVELHHARARRAARRSARPPLVRVEVGRPRATRLAAQVAPSTAAGARRAGPARGRRAGSSRSAPSSRSSRAQLPAARPPPMIRRSTLAVAPRLRRAVRAGELLGDVAASMPGSSTTSTSSPASTTVSALGTKPPPSRRTEITSAPSGSARSCTCVAGRRRALGAPRAR